MRTQIKVLFTCLLLQYATSNEMSYYRNSNFAHTRQYNSDIFNFGSRKPTQLTAPGTSPIQYMETPNFEIMLINEDTSNPTWRKYSNLFQQKDHRRRPTPPQHLIEVNYGNHEDFPFPFIDLDRSEIESVLASLGDRKHIFVLHPRNCRPHSSSLDEFENEFLPELLQQLHRPSAPIANSVSSPSPYDVDPIIDRILSLLDSDEQKILDELRKTYEKPVLTNSDIGPKRRVATNNQRTTIIDVQPGGHFPRSVTKQVPKSQIRDMLYKVPCNEGYVFMVESQKNPIDPNSLSDLLLRVMKVVTKMA